MNQQGIDIFNSYRKFCLHSHEKYWRALGLPLKRAPVKNPIVKVENTVKVITARERGDTFTIHHRNELIRSGLPNKSSMIDTSRSRMLGGTFTYHEQFFLGFWNDMVRSYTFSPNYSGFGLAIIDSEGSITSFDVCGTDDLYVYTTSFGHVAMRSILASDLHPTSSKQLVEKDPGGYRIYSLVRTYKGGPELLLVNNCNDVILFDLPLTRVTATVSTKDGALSACYLQDHTHNFVTGGFEGQLFLWDRRIFRKDYGYVKHFDIEYKPVIYVDSRQDGTFFVARCGDGEVYVFDIRGRGYPMLTYHVEDLAFGTNNYSTKAKYSPLSTGGRYVYTGIDDGSLVIIDTMLNETKTLKLGTQRYVDASWSTKRNEIVTASSDGNLYKHFFEAGSEDAPWLEMNRGHRRYFRQGTGIMIGNYPPTRYMPVPP